MSHGAQNAHNVHVVERSGFSGGMPVLTLRAEHVTDAQRRDVESIFARIGGDPSGLSPCADDPEALYIVAARHRLEALARELGGGANPALADEIKRVLEGEERSRNQAVRKLKCRDLELELGRKTLIMGILNITPDSFSDGGRYMSVEAAVRHARKMVEEGADIIDVGGESTRPGAEKVPLDVELERVMPVLRALKKEKIGVPISIDTYKAEVARRALEAGAHIVNDQWRLVADPEMAGVAAEYGCPVILMHNRQGREYKNLLSGIVADLRESIAIAHRAGIRDEQIILDPGIGFAKTYEDNLSAMNVLAPLTWLGYPVLLGTSRKSMIRLTLDLPAHDVIEGTAATVAYGIAQGCAIVRVHDVKEMKRVAAMTDAMVRAKGGGWHG